MNYTGTVFERQKIELATLEATLVGELLICKVLINGNMIIQFPLPADSDFNEVALRVGNIVNQTMLVDNPVHVEVVPTA